MIFVCRASFAAPKAHVQKPLEQLEFQKGVYDLPVNKAVFNKSPEKLLIYFFLFF